MKKLLEDYGLYNDDPKISQFHIYNDSYQKHIYYCDNENLINKKRIIVYDYAKYSYFVKTHSHFLIYDTKIILNDNYYSIINCLHQMYLAHILYINSHLSRHEENNALTLLRKYYIKNTISLCDN